MPSPAPLPLGTATNVRAAGHILRALLESVAAYCWFISV